MVTGIDGKKGVTGLHKRRYIGSFFNVIGIGTPPAAPALLKDAPNSIIQNLLRRATRSRVFTDGLLGKNGSEMAPGSLQRSHVAGCGQADTVAKAK